MAQAAPMGGHLRDESSPSLHFSTGVKFMGEKQALVTVFDGGHLKDDTLRDIAEASMKHHLRDAEGEVPRWQATNVWMDSAYVSQTRYVQMIINNGPRPRTGIQGR